MLALSVIVGLLFALVILVDTVWRAMPLRTIDVKRLLWELLGAFIAGASLVLIFSGAFHHG